MLTNTPAKIYDLQLWLPSGARKNGINQAGLPGMSSAASVRPRNSSCPIRRTVIFRGMKIFRPINASDHQSLYFQLLDSAVFWLELPAIATIMHNAARYCV